MDGHHYPAGLMVEPIFGVDVARVANGAARQAGYIHVGVCSNLSHHEDKAGRDGRLTGYAGCGIVREDGIQYRVRYLVAQLVRVSLRHRF